jgi:hypothetical protein
VRDYEVQVADTGGEWQTVASMTGNRRRRQTHRLTARASKLRVLVGATNGATRAHLVSVRAYAA